MFWIVMIVVAAFLTFWWWSDHRGHRGAVDNTDVQRMRKMDEGRGGFYGGGGAG